MTELTNNFHDTAAKIRASAGETVSRRTYLRTMRELCGSDTCKCDGFRGGRYRLDEADADGNRFVVVDTERV